MKISSIEHAEQELGKLYDLVRSRGPDGHALDRMWPLLKAAGNPHEKIKVIHVAGTSGKTSTCYYISALLQKSGKQVGLTVSPHVDSITERIQINNQPISEQEFCQELGRFFDFVYAMEETPSYFEVMISFAFWLFAKKNVDYVVAETGLGGLLDGTNTVTREDKICVITDIGMDHMHILGDDIRDIAVQKAGIIQPKNHVFMIEQAPEVMQIIQQRIDEQHAAKTFIAKDDMQAFLDSKDVELPLFQKRNWYISQAVVRYIATRDTFTVNDMNPVDIVVPGRMETQLLHDNSMLILDGAHNGQKVEAFVESFVHLYPDQKAVVLLALKEGKEHVEVLEALRPIVSEMLVTSFEVEQDFPITSQDPEVIAAHANTLGIKATVITQHQQAYEHLLHSSEHIKIVIGSIYLLSQVRKIDHGT